MTGVWRSSRDTVAPHDAHTDTRVAVGAPCTGTTVAGLYVYPRLDPTLNVYTVANV